MLRLSFNPWNVAKRIDNALRLVVKDRKGRARFSLFRVLIRPWLRSKPTATSLLPSPCIRYFFLSAHGGCGGNRGSNYRHIAHNIKIVTMIDQRPCHYASLLLHEGCAANSHLSMWSCGGIVHGLSSTFVLYICIQVLLYYY